MPQSLDTALYVKNTPTAYTIQPFHRNYTQISQHCQLRTGSFCWNSFTADSNQHIWITEIPAFTNLHHLQIYSNNDTIITTWNCLLFNTDHNHSKVVLFSVYHKMDISHKTVRTSTLNNVISDGDDGEHEISVHGVNKCREVCVCNALYTVILHCFTQLCCQHVLALHTRIH